MKKLKLYTLLTIGILIPQVLIPNYLIIILSWLTIGVIMAYYGNTKKVFLTGFLLQAILATVLFFGFSGSNSTFLTHVMENLGLPGFLFAIVFILFNALNVAACLYIGNKGFRLMAPQKIKTN
jgi:hypothetical protein